MSSESLEKIARFCQLVLESRRNPATEIRMTDVRSNKRKKTGAQSGKEAKIAAEQRKAMKEQLKQDWLNAYVDVGWRKACSNVGVSMALPTYWRLHDEQFAEDFAVCKAYQADRLEAVLDATACGENDLTSPQAQLLKFRLQALRPDEYRDRVSVEQSGPGGGPIKIESGEAGRGMELLDRWIETD
jgi:hypothetical protein